MLYFEFTGHLVEMVEQVQLCNAELEQVAESDVVCPLPCPTSASPQNQK